MDIFFQFRDRLTFLRQTFGEGFRSEECIANAQSKYIRGDMSGKFGFLTSSTTVDKLQYQCIRKFSLMEFEFYPVEQGSSEVKLPESSRVPSCVCIAGYEVSEDSEGIVTCRRESFLHSSSSFLLSHKIQLFLLNNS